MPTPKQIVNNWVAALRSVLYIQGKGHLRRVNTLTNKSEFCCLGVLCDRMGIETHYKQTHLPEGVCKTLGMEHAGALEKHHRFRNRDGRELWNLVDLNDGEALTFSQIADFIDAGLVIGIQAKESR